jgi:hypothetical protein
VQASAASTLGAGVPLGGPAPLDGAKPAAMAECPEETGEESRKKKMPGVFWSFRVSIHVGMSWYKWAGCHISKN